MLCGKKSLRAAAGNSSEFQPDDVAVEKSSKLWPMVAPPLVFRVIRGTPDVSRRSRALSPPEIRISRLRPLPWYPGVARLHFSGKKNNLLAVAAKKPDFIG